MSKLFLFLILIANFNLAIAQTSDNSTVNIKGKVIDANNDQTVYAKIMYESQPYGSKIGLLSDSTFSLKVEDGSSYLFTISANGYLPIKKIIDSKNVEEITYFKLMPNASSQLIRLEKLIFELGKATITEESHEELDQLAAMLQANSGMKIQLEGHTDFRGNEKLNFKLSEKRVEAVKDYLVNQGIDKRRIQTKAFGGTEPLSRGSDAESRTNNRRVEVRILAQ